MCCLINDTVYVTVRSEMNQNINGNEPFFVPSFLSLDELRQAIVAMMNRKDELEEQNR